MNNDGTEKYSAIVKVEMNSKNNSNISVYPNPVVGNTIGLQLTGVAEGRGTVKLFNNLGQLVHTTTITNAGNNGSMTIELNNNIAAGTYQLQLIDANENSYKTTVFKIK
jgi:methionine-rich copper-binding protein CopC